MTEEKNLFQLRTPDLYRCNVYRYYSGLSRLYLRVFKGHADAPNFYVVFSDVGYFDGPMNWRGANFERFSAEACLALMVQVGLVEDIMLDDPDTRFALAEAAHLYVVQTAYAPVRIIGGSAVRMDEIPDDLG